MVLCEIWTELLDSVDHGGLSGFLKNDWVIDLSNHHNDEVCVGEEVEFVERMLRDEDLSK